jgi:DNA-directed RNA polymerase specialized sigma24 family protein
MTDDALLSELSELWLREIEGWVTPLVRRLGWDNEQETDLLADIRHRTLTQLSQRRGTIRNLPAFCRAIARNHIRDKLHERKRNAEAVLECGRQWAMSEVEERPEPEALRQEVLETLQEVHEMVRRIRFEALKAEWDAAFGLVYDLNFSMRDAAETLRLPFSTTQYRLARAIETISQELVERLAQDRGLQQRMNVALGEARLTRLLR